MIFRSIMKTNKWPSKWAIEYGVPLKKKQIPETESDLRVISLSAFWSKCMESFLIDWLDKSIGHKIDFTQYGGLKGQSTSHYLIDLINFVLYNQDLPNPQATLAIMYDFEKALNRQDHNTLITILSDLGTPGWLLKLVMAFLEDRRMILKFKGCTSNEENLPGGGPQGTKLGLYLFLILINAAGFEEKEICTMLGEAVTNPKRKPIPKTQQKYIDDMTQAVSLDLKKMAIKDPNPSPDLPRQFHERTGHVLEPSKNVLQEQLDKLKKYAAENKIKINETKTKIMIFNTATSVDILPKVNMNNDEVLEVVEDMKLLGVMIRSDMKWASNTKNITNKCYKRMWMLRNLKVHGANEEQLVRTYIQQIRSITEMACPVWNGAITVHENRALERVQKIALAIIRGEQHTTYAEALIHFGLETLQTRRKNLCLTFALKAMKSQKFSNWFAKNNVEINTRTEKLPLKKVHSRTKRYKISPLPYLTDLLNAHLPKQKIESEANHTNLINRLNQCTIPLSD